MNLPPHMVASQLKILIPVGTAIAIVDSTKKVFACGAHADREHVVGPNAHRDESDADRRRHHDRDSRRSPCARNTGMISEANAKAGMTST